MIKKIGHYYISRHATEENQMWLVEWRYTNLEGKYLYKVVALHSGIVGYLMRMSYDEEDMLRWDFPYILRRVRIGLDHFFMTHKRISKIKALTLMPSKRIEVYSGDDEEVT